MERLKAYTNNIKKSYGFIADPTKSKKDNFNSAINAYHNNTNFSVSGTRNHTNTLLTHQPMNPVVHNLCQTIQPPHGTKNLLGLGLKYCIVPPKATPDITNTMLKLAYRIRTKHYLQMADRMDNQEYIPQLYVKLKNWNPPPARPITEDKLTLFEKTSKEAIRLNNLQPYAFSNLTPNQKITLNKFKQSEEFIILPTDKNLGPAIMNRDLYIKQVLREHLTTPAYLQLTSEKALTEINNTKQLLLNAFNTYKHVLSQAEISYFNRSFKENHHVPMF